MGLFDRRDESRQLVVNSEFLFHALRLIGAAEMAALKMVLHEDEEMRRMGQHLSGVTSWFFAGDKNTTWVDKADARTEIILSDEVVKARHGEGR